MTPSALDWHPSLSEYQQRIEWLQRQTAAHGRAATVISPSADMRYLLGKSQGSHERFTGLVIPFMRKPFLVVPELERPGWAGSLAERSGLEIMTWADHEDPYSLVAAHTDPPQTLFINDQMPIRHANYLAVAAGGRIQLLSEQIGDLRAQKSSAEVSALDAVAAAIDRVHANIGQWLRPGRTENQVATDIAQAIVDEGHEYPDFVIVGSGPHGASPHHEHSERVIDEGEPVVIDIGGPAPSGYFSDSTRTYCIGEPNDPEFVRVHDVVRQAQQAGFLAAIAGSTCEGVDATARAVITEAGYGDYFITRTGHGIGLEVHEPPFMVKGSTTPLAPGMAFSIEPGIYLPGRFGVRIEDIVVIDDDGNPRRLNHSSTSWRID